MSAGSIALATWLFAAPPATEVPEVAAPAEAEQRTRIVVILQPDTSEVVRQAVDAAAAQLLREDVLLSIVPQSRAGSIADKRALADRHGARGVFWFGESHAGRIDVFLATPDAVFVRRVEADPSAAQASVDSTWHIVQSGSSALAMGQRIAMEEVEEEPPAEPETPLPPAPSDTRPPRPSDPAAPASDPRRARVALTAGYLGEGFATAVPWQSGGAVGLVVDAGARARVGLEYGALAPWTGGDPPVRLRHRVMAHVGVHRGFGARVDLGVRLAVAAEILHWRGTSGERGVRPVATIGPDATLEVRIVRGLFVHAALGASAVINRFAFVECEDGTRECSGDRRRVVLAPWWVRPRAQLGLGWRF